MSVFDDLRDVDARYSLDELVLVANRLLPRLLPAERRGMKLNELVNPRLVRHSSTLGLLDEAGREGREARYGRRHLLQLLVARRLMAQGYSTGAIKKLTGGARDEELESLLHGGAQLGVTSPETIVDASLADSAVADSAVADSAAADETAASESESSALLSDAAFPEAFEDAPSENAALSFLQNIRSGRKRAALPDAVIARSAPAPAPRLNAPLQPPAQASQAPPRYVRIALRPGLELHVSEDFELPPSVAERETLMHDALRLLKEAHKGGGRRKR